MKINGENVEANLCNEIMAPPQFCVGLEDVGG